MVTPDAIIINLTPHVINMISHRSYLYKDEEPVIIQSFHPSGDVARVVQKTQVVQQLTVAGQVIDITRITPMKITGLPEPKEGTYYAVSKIVAEQLKGRGNLLVMHGLYKKNGRTIGCRSFTQW